jgi:hypothetical protein
VARAGPESCWCAKMCSWRFADNFGRFQRLNAIAFAIESVFNSILPNRRDNGHIKDGNAT